MKANRVAAASFVDQSESFDSIDTIDSTGQMVPIDSIDPIDSVNQNGRRHWYVIYTKPHAEDQARDELEKKAISVFLPRIRELKFYRQKLKAIIQPLFPNYIFARFTIPDEYYDVKWSRGVKRIVGSGDLPIPLDDSIVLFLKQQANEQGLIQRQPNLKHGDKVRVRQGPLEGLWGVVHEEIGSRDRVKILMDVLHSGAKVELPYSYVERFG